MIVETKFYNIYVINEQSGGGLTKHDSGSRDGLTAAGAQGQNFCVWEELRLVVEPREQGCCGEGGRVAE